MASRSKDYIFHKSGVKSGPDSSPDSVHESEAVPDCEDRNAGEVEETISPDSTGLPEAAQPDAETQAAPAASPDPGEEAAGEDEELLEMLEQLSETIDTAHNVLSEQQELASGTPHTAQPAPHEFSPPPPPIVAKRSGVIPLLAASAGVLLGVGALAVSWLLWRSPPSPDTGKLAKAQDRVTETVVSRSPLPMALTPRADPEPAATPEPQTPSQPDGAAAPSRAEAPPAPAKEREPPADEPAAVAGPAATSTKETLETAAIPAEKTPDVPPLAAEPDLPPLAAAEEARLLERGKELTASGDISSTRLAYEYAAHRGSVNAMFALAQTYDPEMLAAWSVVGIRPDMSAALKWYGRAAGLGHGRAGTRKRELERLIGR